MYSSGGPLVGYAVKSSTTTVGAFLSATGINISRGAFIIEGNVFRWYNGAEQTVAVDSSVTMTQRMTMDENGRLGIANTSPSYTLDVSGDARVNAGALGVNVAPNATDGRIDASNDIVAYSSDRRLKTNIQPLMSALMKVQSLSGFTYNWNYLANQIAGFDTGSRLVGVYAQDVQSVLPEAVKLAPFDNDGTDVSISGENYLTVQYEKIVPLLIEAIKELKAEIEELKQGKCE